MTPRDPLPEPWRAALERKGITTRRGLAAAVDISPQTAKRLVDRTGQPSSDTVNAIADQLFNGDRNFVWSLVDAEREDHGDFQLPPEASQLDDQQRDAVLAVVRAMLPRDGRGRRVRAHPETPPPDDNIVDLVPPISEAVKRAARKGRPQRRQPRDES